MTDNATIQPGPPVQSAITLMPHQQQIHDFLVSRPFAGAWLGIGSGKTGTALSVLQTVRPMGHILVIAPVPIARSTWLDEIAKWGFPIRTKSLIVNDNDRKLSRTKRLQRFQEVFTDPPTMYFVNQELLTQPPRRDCTACHGRPSKGSYVCRQCQGGLVDQMPIQNVGGQDTIVWPFQTVIIDESQGFRSHDSGRFKALSKVRPAISRLIELTGTPCPAGLHDLWSQVYLLDQGQALGQNITAFRNRWFIPKMVPGTTTPSKWIPTPNAEQEIHQAIAHLAMSARNTSLKMPPLTIQDVNVTLPPDLLQAYKDFKRDLVLDVVSTYVDGDGRLTQSVESIVAENQAVLTSKLMQFASGTLYTADPDDPATKGRYQVIHDKKIEMVEYIVRNNGGEPVLLPYHFRSDLEQLLIRLPKAGFDAQFFDGSRDMVRRWNAGQIQVMLLHPASAGHGLNLQDGGSTMIWYTLPFSLEHYLQTNGRLFRTGQTKPVTIHRLIAKGTQDERMPSVLAVKQQTQDNLIEAVSGDASAELAFLAALEEEIREDLNGLWASERV
ncbi:DEAD/DEAH box helicase [Arthrobacter sp. NPDC056691]|uniref:DEAD/DEAH box helicase n=1 Tax=Arthrobacter sp. NPDC056691 TaxID=3345913 RepID=UPI0036714873